MAKEDSPTSQEEFVRLDWRLTGKGEIPCQVSCGMFHNERIVTIVLEKTIFQFLINEDFVETETQPKNRQKVSGFLRVSVKQEKEDSLVVVVSGEPAGNHGTYIEIPKDLVRGIKVPGLLIYPV